VQAFTMQQNAQLLLKGQAMSLNDCWKALVLDVMEMPFWGATVAEHEETVLMEDL